ncbi:UDP-3-O-[3-hydroxymyristoyl] glucosamine N-acyltransferase [Hahella chejuensis KCTC 2396]|uniref:UDP-3-O-acylglucosamine N-acyltransferase n=1 Tax=Hahella chejuensis (strain KCTC 2396) TaxID=349521 RepID=LPXD_HAHCH|nr:UDP-3-O-(3-hydroxymyristoyl)glucosamine N-acyltransferase [Hahella chejuensis]Q2SBQ8.1 RecName: Full=UDP-3-O-acylglucosamine N-acyltransferase [Hahella chejuensis KCTC 2396]ABC31916.1 UDP-3-O-[3-hydroxymyristoyl] glucosamine N-acyltransferase [Hahella chejuensis KCTC 2396]
MGKTDLSYTLADIAFRIGAELRGDGSVEVKGLATLQKAQAGQISFLANKNYLKHLKDTCASAVIIPSSFADQCSTNVLVMENSYFGYALCSQLFSPQWWSMSGISPSAAISESAKLGAGVTIGANVVIEEDAEIGEGAVIGPGCYIGAGSIIGAKTQLRPNVTVYHGVNIGARALIHSGAVIGSDGFGFAPNKGDWAKIAQLGGVVIGDDVEIGANTTIDRGALDDTVIETGAKLDNQIQIAHNVKVGAYTVIAACVGVSGSSSIGKHCMIGGGVGIAGHLEITDQVQITGMTLVTHNIKEPGVYSSGTAVEPNASWRKNVARFRQLDQLARRVRVLEQGGRRKSDAD